MEDMFSETVYEELMEPANTFKRFIAILLDGILLSVRSFIIVYFVVPSPKIYKPTIARSGAVKRPPPGPFKFLQPKSNNLSPHGDAILPSTGNAKHKSIIYKIIDLIDPQLAMFFSSIVIFCPGYFLVYFLYISNNLHDKQLQEKNCLD
jgi:hypothetical protein